MKYTKNYKIDSMVSLILSAIVAFGTLLAAGHINENSINSASKGKGPYLFLLVFPFLALLWCVLSIKHSSKFWKILPILGIIISLAAVLYILWIQGFTNTPG
jgi:ABC-type Na+ efflux pump permease subunit